MTNTSYPARIAPVIAHGSNRVAEANALYHATEPSLCKAPTRERAEGSKLPRGWSARAVSEMGQVLTGKALAVNALGAQRPYLRTKNVLDGEIDVNDVLTMPMTDQQLEQFRVLPGDVLLNEGQSLELVGRCAMYGGEYVEPCAMQNQLLRFRARRGTSAVFASHLFRYAQQTGVFARVALQTTSIAHLGGSRFEKLVLGWPDDEREQAAIAEALSDVDGLLAALDALIAKKRAIKQAAMQQLLTGKTRLPGFDGSWTTKRLGELADVDPENLPTSTSSDFSFNYISLENVEAGRLTGYSQEVFRTAPSRARRVLRAGDVLMATVRPNLMAHLHFPGQIPNAICSTGFAVLRSKSASSVSPFLFAQIFGFGVNNQIEKLIAGSNYPAINSRDVKSLVVPCPPTIEEQSAVAAVLADMDSEVSALERRRDKTRAIKQGMMQQLLSGRVRLIQPSGDGHA